MFGCIINKNDQPFHDMNMLLWGTCAGFSSALVNIKAIKVQLFGTIHPKVPKEYNVHSSSLVYTVCEDSKIIC